MKTCVLSESSADEAAIRILIEGLCGKATERIEALPLHARGAHAVIAVLETLIKHLYYHTDAEALAVVVDSDLEPVHIAAHDLEVDEECRLCLLRKTVARAVSRLRPVCTRPGLKIALGMAVPAIEAWYLVGHNHQITEAAWSRGLQAGQFPYDKNQLKREVYTTDRPGLAMETKRACEESRRLVQILESLENAFPGGFGSFAADVRTW